MYVFVAPKNGMCSDAVFSGCEFGGQRPCGVTEVVQSLQ